MRKPDVSITLDLPPKSSHPNARTANWRLKAKPSANYARAAAEIVWLHALELGQPKWKAVTIRLSFVLPAPAKPSGEHYMDPDGLLSWAKKPIDLLQIYGIIENDRDVIYLPPLQRRAAPYVPGYEMTRTGLTIDIWQRRDGECPFCGRSEPAE
jgi:hypothetical protein